MRINADRASQALLYWMSLLVAVWLPAVFWRGGCLEAETVVFIPQYTDDRTVLQKVFDPHANDFHTYQARELSYLIDYLDANVYMLLLTLCDVAFFIPLSALVASLLIGVIFYGGVRKTMPQLDRLTAGLVLLLGVTSFGFVSTMGLFYRSSKPVLAPTLLAVMFALRRVAQKRGAPGPASAQPRSVTHHDGLVIFSLATVMGLLDRQGFGYILIACGILWLHYWRTGALKDLLIASGAAAALVHPYNLLLGPLLIRSINGYWPNFAYQWIPLGHIIRLPRHVLNAFQLLMENAVVMLGGLPRIGSGLLIALAAHLILTGIARSTRGRRIQGGRRERTSSPCGGLLYALIVFLLQGGMFALMLARHPYVYDWLDHRYWYYPIAFLMTVLFGLALYLNWLLPGCTTRQRQALQVALFVIALSNVLHLGSYKTLMVSSPWFGPVYTQSAFLKASIAKGAPDPRLDAHYGRLYVHHQHQRTR